MLSDDDSKCCFGLLEKDIVDLTEVLKYVLDFLFFSLVFLQYDSLFAGNIQSCVRKLLNSM